MNNLKSAFKHSQNSEYYKNFFSLFGIKSTSKIRTQEPLAKKMSLYQSKVKDKDMLGSLANLILGYRQVRLCD